MVVGLLFGFRQKKQLQILALVNITTQLLLNLLLNIIHYNAGPLAFITIYVFFEVIVFALEAGLYCRFLKRVSPKRENGDFVLYSFIANSASFWVGYYLATVLPGNLLSENPGTDRVSLMSARSLRMFFPVLVQQNISVKNYYNRKIRESAKTPGIFNRSGREI